MKMNEAFTALILVGLLVTAWPPGSFAGVIELSRNPFSRPAAADLSGARNKNGGKPTSPSSGAPALRVTATLVSDDNPMAMVNGKLVGIGERIRGARLVKVEEGAAWFEYRGRHLKYRIRPRQRSGKFSPL